MLLAEFGSKLYQHPDKHVWEKVLAVYGQMQAQLAAIQSIDTLFRKGDSIKVSRRWTDLGLRSILI